MEKILIVDDESSILKVLSSVLNRRGYETAGASNGEEALEILERESFDLMITDLRLGDGIDGVELLHRAREKNGRITTIMITGYGTVDVAVQAMKEGAFDFITKPFKMQTLQETVANALHHHELRDQTVSVPDQDVDLHYGTMVGESDAVKEVYRLIDRVAKIDATVLIQGESGTGKELVAQAIHNASNRKDGPYVPLNCAALSPTLLESEMFGYVAGAFTGAGKTREGLFVTANGGTLLLDEIQSMDLGLQGKLLRALQEKKIRRVGDNKDINVDARVIASCNESLEKSRDEGQFREDLYYRISVIPITLPPLRRRSEDVPLLARYFLNQQSEELGHEVSLDDSAIHALVSYSWPGNIRELQNAIACAAALCHEKRITVEDLPPAIRNAAGEGSGDKASVWSDEDGRGRSLREFLRAKEKEYLNQVLQKTKGNRAKAADMLGISRATLYRKLPEEEKPEQ